MTSKGEALAMSDQTIFPGRSQIRQDTPSQDLAPWPTCTTVTVAEEPLQESKSQIGNEGPLWRAQQAVSECLDRKRTSSN